MSDFLFKDRDGQTPLPEELKKGLKPTHIQNMGELDEYEEANIAEGLIWLSQQTKDPIDRHFWYQLHKKLFSDVWSWAGEVRDHELNNPDFLMPYNIRQELKKLEDDVKYWIENKTYPLKKIATRLHERLLTIHPFANGNGRFSRIIIEYFCSYYKIEKPTWGNRHRNLPEFRRKQYINAVVKARKEYDFEDLENFIFRTE